MQDLFSGLVIGALGGLVLLLLASRYRSREVQLLAVAYIGHVAAGFAQVLITSSLYGSGDIFGYAHRGEELAAALSIDFQGMGWELLKLLFHQDAMLPISISGVGSATGSMSAIAAFTTFFTGGGVYASCILLGVLSFYGKLAAYEVFRQSFAAPLHERLLIANVLVPSVVFWSSGLLKEAVAIVGLGPMMLGIHRWLRGQRLSGLLFTLGGATAVGLVKAYILFAFVVAAAAWIYATRAWKGRTPSIRPVHLLLGLGLAVGGLTILGKVFPQYAIESLADQAAYHQEVGQRVRGASTYELMGGDPKEAGISMQLLYAPLGLFTCLYRPFIFEGTNPQMFVNALETTTLLIMTIWVLWKVPLKSIWALLISSPLALFSLVFVVAFGTAVGLTTTNLGALSRYRVPLVPFFASLLVLLMGKVERPQRPTVQLPQRPGAKPGAARPSLSPSRSPS